MDPEIAQLVGIVDRAYNKRSWHGTSLRGSVRGLTAERAAWRPGRGRHSIWELVVHAAYWKYAVLRRLTGRRRGSFPLEGSNWFARDGRAGDAAWKRDVALLDQTHAELREAIASMSAHDLHRRDREPVTNFDLIAGIAAHDLYHAGQIQLLKRLGTAGR
jgi:hypothetical protein